MKRIRSLLLWSGIAIFVNGPARADLVLEAQGAHSQIEKITSQAQLDGILGESKVPVLIDFKAAWCGPCKLIHPTLEKLQGQAGARFKIVEVDVDEMPDIAKRFKVDAMPTLVANQNSKETRRQVGVPATGQEEFLLSLIWGKGLPKFNSGPFLYEDKFANRYRKQENRFSAQSSSIQDSIGLNERGNLTAGVQFDSDQSGSKKPISTSVRVEASKNGVRGRAEIALFPKVSVASLEFASPTAGKTGLAWEVTPIKVEGQGNYDTSSKSPKLAQGRGLANILENNVVVFSHDSSPEKCILHNGAAGDPYASLRDDAEKNAPCIPLPSIQYQVCALGGLGAGFIRDADAVSAVITPYLGGMAKISLPVSSSVNMSSGADVKVYSPIGNLVAGNSAEINYGLTYDKNPGTQYFIQLEARRDEYKLKGSADAGTHHQGEGAFVGASIGVSAF